MSRIYGDTEQETRAMQDAAINNYLAAVRAAMASLAECKPIIKANAGKVYNKNVKEAFDSPRDREKMIPSRYVYTYTWSSRPNEPYIHISADYQYKRYADYMEYSKYEIELSLILTKPEGNARPRLDAAATISAIDEKLDAMKKEISDIIQARAGLDTYFQKIEEAKKAMQEASEAIKHLDNHYGTGIFEKIYGTTYNMKNRY